MAKKFYEFGPNDTVVSSIGAIGNAVPTVDPTGVANLSGLFSVSNTLNNLDNVRVSSSDQTTAKAYIDGKQAPKLYGNMQMRVVYLDQMGWYDENGNYYITYEFPKDDGGIGSVNVDLYNDHDPPEKVGTIYKFTLTMSTVMIGYMAIIGDTYRRVYWTGVGGTGTVEGNKFGVVSIDLPGAGITYDPDTGRYQII